MNIAFAGFRHNHIFSLYKKVTSNENVTLIGCFEDDENAKNAVKESLGVNFNYNSYEEILNDKSVDIIAIGDYYQKRGSMIISALKAGKHVICDKPLCTDLKELYEIRELCETTNLKVCCMLDLRYLPQVPKACEIIRSGQIGEILNVSFTGQHFLDYGNRPGWYFEDGKHGGTINDIAIHGIDLVRFITGKNLTKINCARVWNAFADKEPDFKDCGQFMIEMENMSVMADVSYAAPGFKGILPTYWDFYFWGTKGMLKFNMQSKTLHIFKEAEEIIEFDAKSPDYLNDFILEINGKNTILDTMDILSSQEQVLKIQYAAQDV